MMAQNQPHIRRILSFQHDLNKKFAEEEKSPLPPKDFEQFKELDFFEVDTSYCIVAKFIRTPYESPFIMKTTTGTEPLFVKYGEAHFLIQEQSFVLNIYQNQELVGEPGYDNYLFLPFTDTSNGSATYTNGRYIDLKIPDGETILLDFNTAYNPNCAYSDRYSCPVPPEENHLDIEILAGVRKFRKHPDNE
ncbi:DUF1684 domain-containing protein [Aquimarina sp. U1-2]|nr:DUF1684 domain-containing protein [Aquimarina sp. U1-2]